MKQRFEILAVDLFGPLVKSPTGLRWIFIIEDAASRWVELFALQEATALACANTLLEEVVLRYGVPRRIVSDNGVQFVADIMQKMTHCLGIYQALTPVYHPQANMVERKNRDLKAQLAILVGNDHPSWPDKIASIRFAMNTAKCSSTGYSAAYLTFGRELRSPDDVVRDLRTIVASENFVPEITPKLLSLADTLREARETHEMSQDTRKKAADKHQVQSQTFEKGDKVMVTSHVLSNADKGVTAKLAPRRDGPYVVIEKIGPVSYRVALNADSAPLGTYHVSSLQPFRGDETATPVIPIKRRGRPRKADKEKAVEPATKVKRGRGRSKKQ